MPLEVKIQGGSVALVDSQDADLVSKFKWIIRGPRHTKYAMNSDKIMMHNLIMKPPVGLIVDHINGDGLDNRRENLRICTPTQNAWNRRKFKSTKSHFKGVTLDTDTNIWIATIVQYGERIRLGRFKSEIAAAKQYDRAARLLFGKFAKTNESLGLLEQYTDRIFSSVRKVRKVQRVSNNDRWYTEMSRIGISPKFA